MSKSLQLDFKDLSNSTNDNDELESLQFGRNDLSNLGTTNPS